MKETGIAFRQSSYQADSNLLRLGISFFFNDSVSATDEVNLFIQTYEDLEVGSIFGSLNGFFANMGAITMENIRCEPSVDSIEYNGVISIND